MFAANKDSTAVRRRLISWKPWLLLLTTTTLTSAEKGCPSAPVQTQGLLVRKGCQTKRRPPSHVFITQRT